MQHLQLIWILAASILICSAHGKEAVYRGANVNFTCSFSSGELLVWEYSAGNVHNVIAVGTDKKGNFIYDGRYALYTSDSITRLMIYDVKLEEEGFYTCNDFFNRRKQEWQLEIYVVPDKPLIMQNDTADEGELYIIECAVNGGKPLAEFRWQLIGSSGNELDLSSASRETFFGIDYSYSKLGVILTRRMVGAFFVCNSYQPGLEKYYNETVAAELKNAKFMPLSPVMSGSNITMKEGEQNNLTCLANYANPAALITWNMEVRGQTLDLLNTREQRLFFIGYYTTESWVYFNATRDMNGAKVTCHATNEVVVRKNLRSRTDSNILNVDYRPVMRIGRAGTSLLNATLREGADFTIPCEVADAKPRANFTEWLLNGKSVAVASNSRYTVGQFPWINLAITGVNRYDVGYWQCNGSNIIGHNVSEKYHIDVLHKPACKDGQRVKFASREGSSVTLTCNVLANPNNVTFMWRKFGNDITEKTIGESDRYDKYLAYSRLTIIAREASDYGIYECIAENRYGLIDSACNIELQLPGPADAPAGCQTFNGTTSTLSIQCTPTFDGGSEAWYALMVLYNSVYTLKHNQTVPRFLVADLLANQNYTFRVCASNANYWMSQKCTPPFSGLTLPTSDSQLVSVGIVPASSNAVTIGSTSMYIIIGAVCLAIILIVGIVITVRYIQKNKSHGNNNIEHDRDVKLVNASQKYNHNDKTIYGFDNLSASMSSQRSTSPTASMETTVSPPQRNIGHYNSTGITLQQHNQLMQEVKDSIRNGTLKTLDDDLNVDPDKLPMTLL